MEQVYLAPCTEYQYEPLKQAVDDIFDHLALNRFLFQGANVCHKTEFINEMQSRYRYYYTSIIGGCSRYESKRTWR